MQPSAVPTPQPSAVPTPQPSPVPLPAPTPQPTSLPTLQPSPVGAGQNINIESIHRNFQEVPTFDTSLRYDGDNVFHLVGERSLQYDFERYQNIFPNIKKDNVNVVEGAGHWVHFDKPLETIQLVSRFLKDIDESE